MNQMQQSHLMEQNLERMIKNQNYFSCFFDNATKQQEPSNPFQKRMFDKNLRRSTMSCGHYNSTSNHNRKDEYEQKLDSSPRKNVQNNDKKAEKQNPLRTLIEKSHKVNFAQSRHSDPYKQQISQIIDNFRQELEYLEEKLHQKVDQYHEAHQEDVRQVTKQGQLRFMVQSLDKIVGFMIQNCVNLHENIIYGEFPQQKSLKKHNFYQGRQIYSIEEENQNKENISFNADRASFNRNHPSDKKKKKIMGIRQVQDSSVRQRSKELPRTYFVNDKIHNNDFQQRKDTQKNRPVPHSQINHDKRSQENSRFNKNYQEPCHSITYHSSKQHKVSSSNSSFPSESYHQTTQPKSIYETVLQQRQMKIRNKKKMI